MAHPYRWTFVVAESFVAIGGLIGAIQLLSRTYAPPIEDLDRLGLVIYCSRMAWRSSSVSELAG